MILQLRSDKIYVRENTVPEYLGAVSIRYDFELGTNHYRPVLSVNGVVYEDISPTITLDLNTPTVVFKVDLYDSHARIVKTYTGTFNYLKLCLVGTDTLVNILEKAKELYKENIKLKEQGEVI